MVRVSPRLSRRRRLRAAARLWSQASLGRLRILTGALPAHASPRNKSDPAARETGPKPGISSAHAAFESAATRRLR